MTESGPSSEVCKTLPEAQFWNDRYTAGGTSGYGSYGEQLEKKLGWLGSLDVTSILEVGCGDFNFGKNLIFKLKLPFTAYTGYDIAPYIVERNRKYYPSATFESLVNGIPDTAYSTPGELVLCIDVLFHVLDDENCGQLLDNLEKLWKRPETKYLAITAYERDEPGLTGHVRIRKFDPSRFGTPVVREIVEDDGELYFYLFKK